MPHATTIAGHQSALDIWQRALESERGLRLRCSDAALAFSTRQRLYSARRAAQREAKRLYPVDNPMYGQSFYDAMSISVDGTDVLIQKGDPIGLEISEL